MLNSLINFKKNTSEKEYFLIRALIHQLETKIKDENEQIAKTVKDLESEVPLYIDNIKELNNDIKKLRTELSLKNSVDNINNIPEVEESITKIEESDLTIKKLYRIISSKCHPDRTSDETLHELFILATEAYNHNNYLMILEIYNKLTNPEYNYNFSDIDIDKKLELIKKEYDKYKEIHMKLSQTNGYVIYNLIKNQNKTQARKIFINLLFNQMAELENLKKQLESNLNKK